MAQNVWLPHLENIFMIYVHWKIIPLPMKVVKIRALMLDIRYVGMSFYKEASDIFSYLIACNFVLLKVRELIDFIQDDDRLREERKKAKKNKDKYIGMSSDAMGMRSGGYSGGGYNDGGWRTSRSDHGDNWCKLRNLNF